MRGPWGLALALAAAVAAAGCGGPRKPPPRKQEGPAPGPRVTVKDVRLELTDASGELVWEASGKGLSAETGEKQGEIRDLDCRFLEEGRAALAASAREGRVDWPDRRVTLSGDVRGESALGHGEISADHATWSAADRVVRAGGGVEYRRGAMTITAPRLTADTALETVRLAVEEGDSMRQAVVIMIAAAGGAALASTTPGTAPAGYKIKTMGKVVHYAQKNLTVATGGVEATTREGTLWSDKLEATTDDQNRLLSAEATGNVRVDLDWTGSDKKRRRVKAQGDRATYDAATRTVVLIGHVKGNAVEVDKQRTVDLEGDKATFNLRESSWEMEGAPTTIIFAEPEPKPETAPK